MRTSAAQRDTLLCDRLPATRIRLLETHGPLGILWAGLGLSGFYIALIWINSLLGMFLTPLFLIPVTWFVGGKKREPEQSRS